MRPCLARNRAKPPTSMTKGESHDKGPVWRIIELLQQNPLGLTAGQIRAMSGYKVDEQAQLDRRRREVRKYYELETLRIDGKWIHRLGKKRETALAARGVNKRVRAAVIGKAHGRCQMCGRTVEKHSVVLVVDHKRPRSWGGSNEQENLWAICEDCNEGKKAYFATQDQELMKTVMSDRSVHIRIGELLKKNFMKPVPSTLIEFVAGQEDWRKRTRELRYLGWTISATRRRLPSGKTESYYTLQKYKNWPGDPTAWIRDYEKSRERANRKKSATKSRG